MILILILIIVGLILGPQIWARRVLRQFADKRDDISGTGGELATHILKEAGLKQYTVEIDELGVGDHFDPINKTVRLSRSSYNDNSLTAIVVAAHEVGHAIQDHIGFGPLKLRTRLARVAGIFERVGSILLIAIPIVTMVTRTPQAGAALLIIGMAVMLLPVLVHLITLPVEVDASFNRALPLLSGRFLSDRDIPKARKILSACALTYLAASLSSLLNVWRWIRFLKR
ncbi:MAG: zinc metallopeptidase [Gammaproteobacteria bacterium]|jgi:Zn-dependent membrane protease YugP